MLQFKIFQPHQNKINHGFTMKGEGNFKEEQPDFKTSIAAINLKNTITTRQIHTDKIIKVEEGLDTPDGDALICHKKGVTLMIKVADCQGILIFDPITKSIAAVHSGWKSSCLNIIGKTVQKMEKEWGVDPQNLLVGIGPSLGPCCCEFSHPEKELPDFIHPYILANNHVDFWKLTIDQLKNEGVLRKNIEIAQECTKCNQQKYYSYRNNDKERMGVFIALR